MSFELVLFGIPVSVHWSTIIILVLFSADAFYYIKQRYEGSSKTAFWLTAIGAMFLAIFSIVVHEGAHALASMAFGIKITNAGIFGIGAYVSTTEALSQLPPMAEILIAFAGPASNFILAGIGILFISLMSRSLSEAIFRYFSYINIRLGRINLWPIFILDGARIAEGLVRGTLGQHDWTQNVLIAISIIFLIYLFTKKKGRTEIEDLLDRID